MGRGERENFTNVELFNAETLNICENRLSKLNSFKESTGLESNLQNHQILGSIL